MSVLFTRRGAPPKIMSDPEGDLGDITIWDNKEWLVCHIDYGNNIKYLIASDTVDNTVFGGNNTYAGSTLAARCTTYQNESMSAAALKMIVDTTVNNVTAKVFIPSYEQLKAEEYPDQGFSWFRLNSRRKVAGAAGYRTYYWTSSANSSDRVWDVVDDGRLYGGNSPSSSLGFRPCVCVQCKNPIPFPDPGAIITFDDKKWLVCHYDSSNNQVYLISKDIISETVFGGNATYTGSTLASVAAAYQTNNMSVAALRRCVDTTVNGVTAKVFVPSYEQMNGGFSWFNNDINRVAKYNGDNDNYWTSSANSSNYAWHVYIDGSLQYINYDPSYSIGFRPCICVQL